MFKTIELEMRRLGFELVCLTLALTPFFTLLFWLLSKLWETAQARGKVNYFRRKNMTSFPKFGTRGKLRN